MHDKIIIGQENKRKTVKSKGKKKRFARQHRSVVMEILKEIIETKGRREERR